MTPAIIGIVSTILNKVFTSNEEKAKITEALVEIEQRIPLAQLQVNTTEASHRSIFVAGWRPFIGWICGLGLAYDFLAAPILTSFGYPMVKLDTATLVPLLIGMLGLGSLRTFEKIEKVSK